MKNFIDHDGLYLPYPGMSHPAIEQYREFLEDQDETVVTVDPGGGGSMLFFIRSETIAQDEVGECWRWTVWVDQHGRALSESNVVAVG